MHYSHVCATEIATQCTNEQTINYYNLKFTHYIYLMFIYKFNSLKLKMMALESFLHRSSINFILSTCTKRINYRIAQNSGRGKLWRIWRIECHSPIFYTTKFILIFCKTVDFRVKSLYVRE